MNQKTETPRLDAIVMQLLQDLHEASGDTEEFGFLDDCTITCRSGDCCIRLHSDGWEYAKNRQRHETPLAAWQARNKEPHYRYTVITQQNAAECDSDPVWFKNHPEWTVLLRSDKKWPGRTKWICGGGATIREARECLEAALQELVFHAEVTVTIVDADTSIVMPIALIGAESIAVIKDQSA